MFFFLNFIFFSFFFIGYWENFQRIAGMHLSPSTFGKHELRAGAVSHEHPKNMHQMSSV